MSLTTTSQLGQHYIADMLKCAYYVAGFVVLLFALRSETWYGRRCLWMANTATSASSSLSLSQTFTVGHLSLEESVRGKNAGQEGKREARVRQGISRTKIDWSLVRQTETDRDCERQKQKETDRQRLREAEAGRLIDRDRERETDGSRLARENKRELYGRQG